MVQAIINIKDRANRILSIVKAKYGLKDKSQAIELIIAQYETIFFQPELCPEYVEKIENLEKNGKIKRYSSLKELRDTIKHA